MMAAGDSQEKVKLLSGEGEMIEVSLEVVHVSRTLSTMFKELGHRPDDVIPLPNVSTRTLKKVLAWAEHYTKDKRSSATVSNQPPHLPCPPSSPTTPPSSVTTPFQPRPQPYVPQRSSNRLHPPPGPSLTPWEREFIAKNKDDVHDLLLAANYLDIKRLLDILCGTVADMIKGRDPDEIRRAFHASTPSHLNNDTPPSSPQLTPSQLTPSQLAAEHSAMDDTREHSSNINRGFKESTV